MTKTSFKDVDIPSWVDDSNPPEAELYVKTPAPTSEELEEIHNRMRAWLVK